ncbi:MAG TPA: SDR family oxidoreductase [Bacteroidota bacterium]|nr:SDR family oxidoreductase [Bacteroidota bacterium]
MSIALHHLNVFVTGASSGIGEACARAFAREGANVLMCARRLEKIEALARHLEDKYAVTTHAFRLDVRDRAAVERAVAELPPFWERIDILVNNAGLSRGLVKLHAGEYRDWEEMIDTNVKGLLYVTRTILPGMVSRNSGHVINMGSIAGHQLYPNGNVYCASKFAVAALSEGLRMDLLGTNVRVSSVDPGLVETEFSEVRFRGDKARAAQTYVNMRPLKGEDVAEAVIFCATRPPHVDIAQLIIMPTDQASVNHVHRSA